MPVHLVTVYHQNRRRAGLLKDEGDVIDLNAAYAAMLRAQGAALPQAAADAELPSSMRRLLSLGSTGRDNLQHLTDWLDRVAPSDLAADGPDRLKGLVYSLDDVQLAPPVPDPARIICVGHNYAAHVRERGARMPDTPVFFTKLAANLIGDGEAIRLPEASAEVDYEGELAAVIGRSAYHVSPGEALEYIAGYTAFLDITARDYQRRTSQWMLGKNFDTFAPCGPVLRLASPSFDPQSLRLRTWVGDELRQDAVTSDMIFPVAELVSELSKAMTLQPGDLVVTGTPSGVGEALDPPQYLQPGERVTVEIDGIGRLSNPVM